MKRFASCAFVLLAVAPAITLILCPAAQAARSSPITGVIRNALDEEGAIYLDQGMVGNGFDEFKIDAPFSRTRELAGLDGATVKLFGTLDKKQGVLILDQTKPVVVQRRTAGAR